MGTIQATPLSQVPLGQTLLHKGIISSDQLNIALTEQKRFKAPLGKVLVTLGFVTAAIGIPITGAIGDRIGLQSALMTQAILAAATIVLAWYLPSEKEVDRLAAAGELATPDRVREASPAAASTTSG